MGTTDYFQFITWNLNRDSGVTFMLSSTQNPNVPWDILTVDCPDALKVFNFIWNASSGYAPEPLTVQSNDGYGTTGSFTATTTDFTIGLTDSDGTSISSTFSVENSFGMALALFFSVADTPCNSGNTIGDAIREQLGDAAGKLRRAGIGI